VIMEEFISEIRAYATRVGVMPTTVIQRAKAGNGSTWRRWESGDSSPTLQTVDRLRNYMAENPPSDVAQEGDAQ